MLLLLLLQVELLFPRPHRLFFLGGSPGTLVTLSDHIFMLAWPLSSISWNMGRPHAGMAWHRGMTMCWIKPGCEQREREWYQQKKKS
jgi:hypothetical protein